MDSLLDNVPCGYFSFTDAGGLVHFNETLCNLLGYTKEELDGQKIDSLFPIATKIFYQTHFFPLLKMQGHAEEIFIFLLAKNKEQLPVLVNAKRQILDGIALNTCACIHVPNRKVFEDELVKAKKEAETALHENSALKTVKKELLAQGEELHDQLQIINRQNQQLMQLNRIATHDLQEPVRKLQVFANRLKDDVSLNAPQQQQVSKLADLARLTQEKLAGMQEYVWLSEANTKPVKINLNNSLSNVQSRLAAELGDCLELSKGNMPVIVAREQQVEELFYQLLKNSIQYRQPGENAKVVITAVVLKRNHFTATIGRYSYRNYLKITVKDEGLGFDNQYNHQVFDLFKKLHHFTDRKGLGLSFCKMIVENHGGIIEAESNPLNGTRIDIYFPQHTFMETIVV